ncbi:uncharacterized protein zgc:111868 [Triplophysa rosa]|uniref:uncharacterized protein zgc:111868 n=1 Tax=Triplophysa rosa TaxID=992332 RepID=UPI0025461C19|nr:uncharacterized protein zgc:111868 [Triplophysa rosa]
MDQQWRRFHLLLVFLTLWKHAIGYPSLNSQVNPRSLRYHKAFSPRGFKSLSDASTKNFPLDVHSNVLAVKSPSSSLFSQGGMSSQLHSQGSGATQLLGASSLHAPGSPAHAKLLSSSGRFTSQVTSRQGSPSHFTSTSQDSSNSKFTASSRQIDSVQGGSASLSGLSSQSQSTSSQYRPVSSAYPSLGSLSMTVSAPSSVKTSQFALSSGSQGGSSQFTTSRLSGLAQGESSHPVGLHVQSQGSPSQLAFGSPQYASASMAAAQSTSNQYNQASAQSLSQKQTSQRLQPSVSSFSQGSPSSGAAWSQSRFSVLSAPAPSKSLASGHLSQSAPASLYSSASMPLPQSGSSLYSQAAGSALSLSQSQAPQKWQKAASLSSQGFQTSSTAVSQNGTPSQGAKFPSRFSLASGSGPSQPVSTQGAGSYGGLAQSLSSSAHYAPAYSKPASSPLGVPSKLTSGPSLYASSSQGTTGGTLGASSRYASAQREVGSNIASLQPQVAAGQYAPAPSLDVKVPVYTHATSSGSSMSSSLQSQTWQPTTSRRIYSNFPTSGAALTQTSFSPPSVQSSSRFSSVAGGTSRLLTQSRGSYTGSSQSLGSVGRYTPGSPAYAKFGASSLGVSSQSTSGQSSSSQHSPLSSTEAGGQPTSSSGYLSAQGESSSSVGSSLLSQGALAKEVLAPTDTSMSFASQTAAVSSGIQVPDAAFQSGSSQASSSLSSLQALSSPVDSVPQSASVSSQVSPFGHPSGSMTPSSGSSVHAASEGVSSASSQAQTLSESAGSGASVGNQGLSGGSTSVLSGRYDSSFGQSAPVSTPSLGSLSGYYGVKG